MVGNGRVITINKVEHSTAISLSLDFRDDHNRILLRLNEDGIVNRSNLFLLHPSKNEFLIENEFGGDFLRATYVNPRVFKITGSVIYCGTVWPIQAEFHNGCVYNTYGIAMKVGAPSCPMQQK